jgi:hypothetical protein
MSFFSPLRPIPLLLALLLFPLTVSMAADPVTEMAQFSVFGKVDLRELAKGDIKTATGAPMSTPRFTFRLELFPAQQPAGEQRREIAPQRDRKNVARPPAQPGRSAKIFRRPARFRILD